ncbi:hypothetical protein [Thalassotalea sp. ND16A]|uniref:hypothetical protein n=1 Tax=Thalassotalea sp. ND16A TaxID=1535422 RepID=UPI00051A472E|nr:hypothetical protein [Thalassotalea sp. ND16A]KGJ88432.1 hypothetical protein ND16A_2516 [Thalassotalea sp. ND16A]
MTFFKSLILAVFATIMLTYVFGVSIIEWFDISIYRDQHQVEPLKAISISALVMVVLVVAALAIVLSVFGTLIFACLLLCGGILLVGVGIFWPIFFIAMVIWLCTREKPISQ